MINSRGDGKITEPVTVKNTRFKSTQSILKSLETFKDPMIINKTIDIELIAENLPTEFSDKPL